MSDLAHRLPEVCAHCGAPLAVSRYSFGLGVNRMLLLPGDEEEADPVQQLKLLEWLPVAHFCSHDCCKAALPELLTEHGFPPGVKDQRIGNAVIQPCACCGKPVNLTQPHRACQKGRYRWVDAQADPEVEWMDLLAVRCQNCEVFANLLRELNAVIADDSR